MSIIEIEKKCCGCGVCVDICSVSALTLARNEEGFYRPYIDPVKCVDCGKCTSVCPVINPPVFKMEQSFYYGWHNDEKVREQSSSGGAFSALADCVLASGGVVFGARYSDDFHSVQMSSTEATTISNLRVSKYCAANSFGLYKAIRTELLNGRKVMLTGTPCQVAAARRVFGNNNSNLLLVDFLCGGNPSAKCYEDYICSLERKFNAKVSNVTFRDKCRGWSNMVLTVYFDNGKRYRSFWEYDPYYFGFCNAYTRDEQCLSCSFAVKHESDITIADFWGFRNAHIANDEKGMSFLAIHSPTGQKAFEEVRKSMTVFELEDKYGNYGFRDKSNNKEKIEMRKQFFERFKETDFLTAAYATYYQGGRLGVVSRKISRRFFGG